MAHCRGVCSTASLQQSSFAGQPFRTAARAHVQLVRRSGRSLCGVVRAEKVLILNTKGGGHAFIGLHLAKQLLKDGHSVTILNDGDEAKLTKKAPYSQYGALAGEGVTVAWGDPADTAALPSDSFDVVYDNNGKDMAACQPAIDHFKGKVAHYVFVASAGAYKGNKMEPALVEGDPRKSSAGHVEVEKYLEAEGLPYTVFQPLYLYGPYNGKDQIGYFLSRIMRERPVPLPAPGNQLTSLTHIEDMAALLAKVPGNKAAIGQYYNAAADRYVTFDGIVKALAAEVGKEPKIMLYDESKVSLAKGEGVPFRTKHFFAQVEKAKRELGWAPKHTLMGDISWIVEDYKASGALEKEPDFSLDDRIAEAMGEKVPVLA